MRRQAGEGVMEERDRKPGKIFLIFAGLCLLALPLVVLAAFSQESGVDQAALIGSQPLDFDQNSVSRYTRYDSLGQDYLVGTSSERTLAEYYSRRQYPGSPPFIPHKVLNDDMAMESCLTCHGKGGWAAEFKRHTPVTPHPQEAACRQCHVGRTESKEFVVNDWLSVAPPRLGRSYLPGGPPPIPHTLQMRGDCLACHAGPAAIAAVRVDHPARGDCRQCHVPDSFPGLYERQPAS